MKRILNYLSNLIFENICFACKKQSGNDLICKKCESEYRYREKNNYIKHLPNIEVFSFGYYEGSLRETILALKSGKRKLADFFALKLFNFWQQVTSEKIQKTNFLVIPVPSHKKRIRERGFCQTSLISKHFSKMTGYKYTDGFVIRRKETKYMNSLGTLRERVENIKNAFELLDFIPEKKSILIVDDIVTSGNTMTEIAKTIKTKYPDLILYGLTIASGDQFN